MTLSSFDQGFAQGVLIRGVPLLQMHPGKVFWVGNSSTQLVGEKTKSDGNKGTFLEPFSTLDYAIGQCAAGRGDIIFVRPSHSETFASNSPVTFDVDNIAVIGLGQGTDAPTYGGGGGTADLFTVTGDNITISNLRFDAVTTAAARATIDISGTNFTLRDSYFDTDANPLNITVTATGEKPWFENNVMEVTANGPTNLVQIEGVIDNPVFKNNIFITSDGTDALDDGGAISFEGNAVTNVVLENNKVMSGGVACNLVANAASVVGVYSDQPYTVTGEMDVDVSESDYTTVGGITALTITPTGPLWDVTLDLDNLKDTTGLLVVNTTETVQYVVQRKVDGTNWRVTDHWPSASSKTGLAVPDAAQDLDAADDAAGLRIHLGNIGANEEVRINVELSAETGGDAEIPYSLTFTGASPVLTAVAAA